MSKPTSHTAPAARWARTALAGCLVAVVAACAGTGGDGEPAGELTEYQAVYLGLGEAGLEAVIDREILTSQQADVAACMAGGGFEYSPLPPESFAAIFDGPPRTSAEFAERFGFLIATQPAIDVGEGASVQMNQEYREALTVSAQRRYDERLAACEESAAPTFRGQQLDHLSREIQDMIARAKASNEWNAANAVWVECVEQLGIDGSSLDDLVLSLTRDYHGLLGQGAANQSVSAEIERFRAREIQIATTTWPCNAEYWSAYRTIVAAYRQ